MADRPHCRSSSEGGDYCKERRGMNIEDDEYCTADYGVFGDKSCACSMCRPPIPKRDIAQEKRDAVWQRKWGREMEVSRTFNSHMIDLYNSARK